MRVGSLFSGAGLLDIGLAQAGVEHEWFVEKEPWRREHLAKRWPGIPVHDDVRTVGAHNLEPVDCIAGGFPCKGASTAGKRTGLAHPETALWAEFYRIVGELRPRYVVIENVSNLLAIHDGAVWGTVLGDLAALGFAVAWDCVPAAAFGAPHGRDRVVAIASHAARVAERASVDQTDAVAGGGRAWQVPLVGSDGATPDAPHGGRAVAADAGEPRGLGQDAGAGGQVVADADGHERPQEHASDDGQSGQRSTSRRRAVEPAGAGGHGTGAGGGLPGALSGTREPTTEDRSVGEDAPDADDGRQPQQPQRDSEQRPGLDGQPGDDALGRGVRVEWGDYEPAIRRWEAVHGPAPEPLVRRLDARRADLSDVQKRLDRSAMRAQRQRLSALGDGVQVQLARLVGEALNELENGHAAEG